jgi:hypothetical protein
LIFGFLTHDLSDDLECVNEFKVDAEGHVMVVEVLARGGDVLQGAGILAIASVHEADVLSFVEFGIATGALDFDSFFETESFTVLREHTGMANRLVDNYLRSLHHELQRDVVDGLLVHMAIVFKITMQMYGDGKGEKKKESSWNFLSS